MSVIRSMQRPGAQAAASSAPGARPAAPAAGNAADSSPEFRQVFDQFVGQTLFGQMLKSMRRSVGKPAYFHGGRAEEIFTQQLDQVLTEKISRTSARQISQPMFELYNLQRK